MAERRIPTDHELLNSSMPDPVYRELFPDVQEAYDAYLATAEGAKPIHDELQAAIRRRAEWRRNPDAHYVKAETPGEGIITLGADGAALDAEVRHIERRLRRHQVATRAALLAYRRLCLQKGYEGTVEREVYRRMIAARDRVSELVPQLVEALEERERYWNKSGKRFAPAIEADPNVDSDLGGRIRYARSLQEVSDLTAALTRAVDHFPKGLPAEWTPKPEAAE